MSSHVVVVPDNELLHQVGDSALGRHTEHSSFAILSGTGTRVVAAPNFDVPPGVNAEPHRQLDLRL